jgi:hypothetical protein
MQVDKALALLWALSDDSDHGEILDDHPRQHRSLLNESKHFQEVRVQSIIGFQLIITLVFRQMSTNIGFSSHFHRLFICSSSGIFTMWQPYW